MLRELPGDFAGPRADPESPHAGGYWGCTHLRQRDLKIVFAGALERRFRLF